MSIKVMNRVWDESQHKGSALLLLLAIADHAADDGYCWPNVKTLAQKIRMSRRQTIRLLKYVEESGELYIVRGNRNHRYVVRIGMTDETLIGVLRARSEAIGDKLTPIQEQGDSSTGDILSSTGDMDVTSKVTQLCHPNHHEPSCKPQGTPASDDSLDEIEWHTGSKGREEGPSVLDNDDPLTLAAACYAKTGGQRSWTVVGPEGANSYEGEPLRAFCEVAQIPERPPDGKARQWGAKLQEIGEAWNAAPDLLAEAIRAIPKSSDHNWRSFGTPFSKSFQEAMDAMIPRVRSGGAGKVIRIRN